MGEIVYVSDEYEYLNDSDTLAIINEYVKIHPSIMDVLPNVSIRAVGNIRLLEDGTLRVELSSRMYGNLHYYTYDFDKLLRFIDEYGTQPVFK